MDTLALDGLDSLANQFFLIIPPPPGGSALATASLNLRVLSVDIPAQTIGTYEIRKRGRKKIRPTGISEQDLQVTFTYRADKYFGVYSMLAQWLAYIQNPVTLAMASDSGPLGVGGSSQIRIDITCLGFDTNNIVTSEWIFKGAWISEQAGITFEETSGDPLTISVTLQCDEIVYPGIATS
jgi:hypothetical protein